MLSEVKKTIQAARKLPTPMKEKILKLISSSSKYHDGIVTGLRKPSGMGNISKKISGLGFGADKNGFFVYTHRARCKSHMDPMKITKKEIDFIETTG